MGLRRRGYLVESYGKRVVVATNELPPALRKALKQVGYKRRDISVEPATATSVRSVAGKGQRGFAMAVNMATGAISDVEVGSWGGQNPFERKPVDWHDKPVKIPPNGAIITGSLGYKGPFATIYVHPDALAPLLPGNADVTEREADILRMASYKSFYKKELFVRNRVNQDEIKSLVERGYMKMNKAGATSLTPKGKNAMSSRSF
jgi:hypothetical protein